MIHLQEMFWVMVKLTVLSRSAHDLLTSVVHFYLKCDAGWQQSHRQQLAVQCSGVESTLRG